MAFGAVLFIVILALAASEHWWLAAITLAIALPYWWSAKP